MTKETELKTLKDLVMLFNKRTKIKSDGIELIHHQVLRQEAIKWVKSVLKVERLGNYPASEFIKEFFNLTEEDLK